MAQKEILIESFTKRGDGLGHILLEGSSVPSRVEIPHTIPKDRVLADLRKKRKRVVKGRLLDILSPSPFRILPPCEHATICGGCTWQALDYKEQVRVKEESIRKLFEEFFPKSQLFPMICCQNPFYYRNKMEFSFSQNRGGMRYLGLMIAKANHYVFNIQRCHLVDSWFSDVLRAVRCWWEASSLSAYRPLENLGTLRTLTLREGKNTQEKMVILTISDQTEELLGMEEEKSFVETVVQALKGESVSIFLRLQKTSKGVATSFEEKLLHGEDHIKEKLLLSQRGLIFKISPSSFFQPNTSQAENLFLKAIEMAQPKSNDLLLDLYCGAGAIGMSFASHVRQVIGIEENPKAVSDGRENLLLNDIQNMTLYSGDVGTVLGQFMEEKKFESPDIIVVDPPRNGLDPLAIEQIVQLKAKTFIYISCNPHTQIENIRSLQPFYRLLAVQPVDQFPHTPHIENIALLERI